MSRVLVFDASGLMKVRDLARPYALVELVDELRIRVEKGRAGFPSQVVEELKVLARDESITQWAIGLGRTLKAYRAPYDFVIPVMEVVCDLGFDEGLESPDGSEPSIVYAAAAACRARHEGRKVCLVSEDVGGLPHRPSMMELASALSIDIVSARTALLELGLDHHLV